MTILGEVNYPLNFRKNSVENNPAIKKTSRRKFLFWSLGAVGVAAGSFAGIRSSGYPDMKGWKGKILSVRQAYIIMSASTVMLPKQLTSDQRLKVAENVDRYIFTLPKEMTTQINLLFEVIENLTFIDLQYKRFSKLESSKKENYLRKLHQTGGDLRLVAKTLRDFCMLGYYQHESSWKAIGYSGPVLGDEQREMNCKYKELIAPSGVLPISSITHS